jgi:RimJ/RimL family protein N-acetyltransferase
MNKKEVYLRAFEYSDLELINKWHNDDEINLLTGGNKYFVSSEYDKKWIENKMLDNLRDIYLGICLKNDNKLIGYISINGIDYRNRTAIWGGIIIGFKNERGKGYAVEAANLMLDYVFNELGINCLYAYWLEKHTSSIKLGEKLGFKKEGILRERIFKSGQYNNEVVMSILAKEFNNS